MKKCSKCQNILTNDNWWESWRKNKTNICISCGRVANKKYDTKDIAKNRSLRRSFNMTLDEYNNILNKQNNRCAICNTDVPSGKGIFHVDHCHYTGKIRGLLCHYCNVGLGNFRDNIINLNLAIKYLIKNNDGTHY